MAAPESTRAETWRPASALGVLTDRQTYLNLLYLLTAFPLGIVYLVVLLLGFSLGIGLLVTLVGIPILLATIVGSTYLATFERLQARHLLGVEIETPTRVVEGEGLWPAVRSYLVARSTWLGLLFLLAKFPLGVASFVVLATLFGVTVGLLTAPLYYDVPGVGIDLGFWAVTTLPGALAAAVVGLVLVVVGLHVLNVFAWASGRLASFLLGPRQ
jgi:hypothetical protein